MGLNKGLRRPGSLPFPDRVPVCTISHRLGSIRVLRGTHKRCVGHDREVTDSKVYKHDTKLSKLGTW